MGDILSSQNTLVPTAPNSVREGAIDTGEINFSFRPARKTTDEIFRLEMVEYIDRYARFAQGETQKSISPATRIAYTDLFANLPGAEKENPKPGITLSKQKAIYSNGRGEATFTGPETRTLQKGETLTIGANKKIYTDSGGSRIIYRPLEGSTNTSSGILVVGASREIEFRESMRIEVLDGVMLLPDGQSTTRSINLASLKGTPVLLGSRIDIARDQSRLDIEYRNTAKLEINSAALYEALTLGDMSDSYRVSLERENAWYYARLGTVESTPTPRVNIRLLSPQKEADMEGPALRLEKGLRAPVYLEERIEMKDFVEDRSGVRDIYFDTDLQKDTNNDGIRNNDPDSTSENLFLRSGSTPTEFFVRAINRPQIIPIKIWATDSNGNISSADSKITIYAPIPEIGDIRSGVVQ